MTRATFQLLTKMLAQSDHIPKGNRFGRAAIPPEKQVAATVWMLATRESSRETSDCFDIVMSSVARCLHRVTRALSDLHRKFTKCLLHPKMYIGYLEMY